MDPFSLSLSVIAASETAFSVARFLTDKCSSYRNAPEEVLEIAHEIAHEINICRCLMTPFGERLKNASVHYSVDFQSSVEYLIRNSTDTFQSIRRMIPDDGNLKKGSLQKWSFVLKKDEVTKHRTRVKQIQQMFLFMKEMMLEGGNSEIKNPVGPGEASKDVPITLTGTGKNNFGASITYTATLIVQPTQPKKSDRPERQEFIRSSIVKDKRDLNILRQSPYFSRELLEESTDAASRRRYQGVSQRKRRAHFEDDPRIRNSRSEEDSASMLSEFEAARDVERLIVKWFGENEEAARSARRPKIVVPEASEPQPPTPVSATKTTSPMQTSPTGYNSDNARSPKLGGKSYSWSSKESTSFLCDSCSQGIEKPFYACSNCSDFHICRRCYDNPEITLRMRHRHPTTRFVKRS